MNQTTYKRNAMMLFTYEYTPKITYEYIIGTPHNHA